MLSRFEPLRRALIGLVLNVCLCGAGLHGSRIVGHPFAGITSITRIETSPRKIIMHIIEVDLTSPGIHFKLTPPAGKLETIRQTTLEYLNQEHAQVAINGHFFLPFPSPDREAMLVGFAASRGVVYSAFETPEQSFAIVANAPAINIDAANHASVVHSSAQFPDGKHIEESATIWNAISGSAQIVTNGIKTIPAYADQSNPSGLLKPGGPAPYGNTNSWYDAIHARSAIGLSQDGTSLVLFTVDRAGGSMGMKVGEVADLLLRDYRVYQALNLDGGGSTSLAMENPETHLGSLINVSSDTALGRAVGSNLAVFAQSAAVRPEQTGVPQNPSPMVEHTRAHPRLTKQTPEGRREKLALGTLFLPAKLKLKSSTPLLVFFHGGSWLPEVAAAQNGKTAVISIQIGAGSAIYAKPFLSTEAFGKLLSEAAAKAGVRFRPITLAGWSAGCGAIRQIMSTPEYYNKVDNTIMIDGIHTSYIEGKPGPLESKIDPANLQIFVKLARDAMAGKKRVIITHSEIFPGTFASTTETADYILNELGLSRHPILKWGPMKTQELSEVRAGRFLMIGFAGNSAPDHVDQLHSLPAYLKWIEK